MKLTIPELTVIDTLRPLVLALVSPLTQKERRELFNLEARAIADKRGLLDKLLCLTESFLHGGATVKKERDIFAYCPLTFDLDTLNLYVKEGVIDPTLASKMAVADYYYSPLKDPTAYKVQLEEWEYPHALREVESLPPPPSVKGECSFGYVDFSKVALTLRKAGLLPELESPVRSIDRI